MSRDELHITQLVRAKITNDPLFGQVRWFLRLPEAPYGYGGSQPPYEYVMQARSMDLQGRILIFVAHLAFMEKFLLMLLLLRLLRLPEAPC